MTEPSGALLLKPLELVLNRGLARSTSAAALARDLEGRALRLEIEGLPFAARLSVTDGRITLSAAGEAPADATLRGGPLSLGRLMREDPQAPLRDGALQMSGDTDVAERFRDLLFFVRPDPEEELSQLLGDPLAHELGNTARAAADWGRRVAESFSRSVAEYLTEESRAIASRAEVREFSRYVDELANELARSEARVSRLESR